MGAGPSGGWNPSNLEVSGVRKKPVPLLEGAFDNCIIPLPNRPLRWVKMCVEDGTESMA